MTIIHYNQDSEFAEDMLDLVALLGILMDSEQNLNKGCIDSGLRIAQGKIQRIRDRIRKEKGIAYFEGADRRSATESDCGAIARGGGGDVQRAPMQRLRPSG